MYQHKRIDHMDMCFRISNTDVFKVTTLPSGASMPL